MKIEDHAMFNNRVIYVLTLANGENHTTRLPGIAVLWHDNNPGSVLQKRIDSDDPVLGGVYTYQDGGWA